MELEAGSFSSVGTTMSNGFSMFLFVEALFVGSSTVVAIMN